MADQQQQSTPVPPDGFAVPDPPPEPQTGALRSRSSRGRGVRAAPYPPDTAVTSRQVPDSALAAAPRRSRRPGATRGALKMLSGADYHEADDRSIQPGSSHTSSAPPFSHSSGRAAASRGARSSGSGGAASSYGARGGRIRRPLGTTGFACNRCRHRFPTRADLEEVTPKVCKQCLSALRGIHTDACTSPKKRIRTKRRVVEAFAQLEGDHSPLESAGDSPMAGDSPGGDGSPPAFSGLGLATAVHQSLSAAAAAAANAPTTDHPHGPSPHATGSMRLVHSPYLKARSPGGSAMRSPQGRHFEYVGLRQNFWYPLLEWIAAEQRAAEEGQMYDVFELSATEPFRRSREKTVRFMNDWRRLGSRKREKVEVDLFARRHTYTGAQLIRAIHRATIGMWDSMLGLASLGPEERANALTVAATSLVTSCSAIKPDVVTKAVYAAGTGAVQVNVVDCERTSRKNMTSYKRYKAGRERKINKLGSRRLWGRFFEFKPQPKTRDE